MEHESTNQIVLNKENISEIKTQVEQDSHSNNLDVANLTSARNYLLEESKEITTKRTSDFNNPNFLASLSYKQDSLAEELESLRETIMKMQEEIKTLSNNYNQLKSEPVKVNKFDASALKKNDLLKNYATTTPNKAERSLKTKKSEITAPKTPLTKTTINLKIENPEEKFSNDRMYKTAKSNIKDLKKTQTDKSVVRKFDKKGDDTTSKKIKLGDHSTTASTDAKDKDKEKISLLTRIKKPLNGGAKTLKDKTATENESKKYLTEKRPNQNVRLSLHEKLKEGDEDKSRKGTAKELAKPLTVSKKNIKIDKSKGELENKKKEEKIDHIESKSNVELSINPFNDQPKNAVSDFVHESVTARENELNAEVKEEKNQEDHVEIIENFTNEVIINLEEESPIEIESENITNEVIINLAEITPSEIKSDNLVSEVNNILEENINIDIKSDHLPSEIFINLEDNIDVETKSDLLPSEVIINLEDNISKLEENPITLSPK